MAKEKRARRIFTDDNRPTKNSSPRETHFAFLLFRIDSETEFLVPDTGERHRWK